MGREFFPTVTEGRNIHLLQGALVRATLVIIIFQGVVLHCYALCIMRRRYLDFSEAVVRWSAATSFMCSGYSCDAAAHDWKPSPKRASLGGRFSHYHYANLFYRYQQYVVSHNLWWERDIKRWIHFLVRHHNWQKYCALS